MIRIPKTPTFLKEGAIVPTEEELKVIIHALSEEYKRVVDGHGDHYGHMNIRELDVLIHQLQLYQRERGEA